MYYYAYINANNIVTQIITLPSAITVANYIPISSADETLIGKYYNAAIGGKVDKVEGKGLSANDFTDALKTKLEGIATGATKVEKSTTNGSIKINGTEILYTPTRQAQEIFICPQVAQLGKCCEQLATVLAHGVKMCAVVQLPRMTLQQVNYLLNCCKG